MTLTMISKWWYFFHDEWMRRGEDYLRKIVGGWHWRKLRISPEFIWDHERRYHHQNHCHHLHHHRCHSLTVKCTFICCAVTPSLSYCHLCHHYSPQNNCIFYCHYNLWNSHYGIKALNGLKHQNHHQRGSSSHCSYQCIFLIIIVGSSHPVFDWREGSLEWIIERRREETMYSGDQRRGGFGWCGAAREGAILESLVCSIWTRKLVLQHRIGWCEGGKTIKQESVDGSGMETGEGRS